MIMWQLNIGYEELRDAGSTILFYTIFIQNEYTKYSWIINIIHIINNVNY